MFDRADNRQPDPDDPVLVASSCHEIRTRGTADHIFLDCHVCFPADMRLDEAHRLDRLMEAFPAPKDVVIHIEPWEGPHLGKP